MNDISFALNDRVFEQVLSGVTHSMRMEDILIWHNEQGPQAVGWFVYSQKEAEESRSPYICVLRKQKWDSYQTTEYPFEWYQYGHGYCLEDGPTTLTMQCMAEIEKAIKMAELPVTPITMQFAPKTLLQMSLEHYSSNMAKFATYWPACVDGPSGPEFWLMVDAKAWVATPLNDGTFDFMNDEFEENLAKLKRMREVADGK